MKVQRRPCFQDVKQKDIFRKKVKRIEVWLWSKNQQLFQKLLTENLEFFRYYTYFIGHLIRIHKDDNRK